jgi:hypothetical protein
MTLIYVVEIGKPYEYQPYCTVGFNFRGHDGMFDVE